MKTVKIKTSWHKAESGVSSKQLKYIHSLRSEENCPEWPFPSTTNAMRSLTKGDACVIINALKNGQKVVFE